jgi:hypothetical protein
MIKTKPIASRTSCASALMFALACGGTPAKAPETDGPATKSSSQASSRERVAVTIYNDNFGLVREERSVSMGEGRVELAYADVSAHIEPETVQIKSLTDPSGLSVLEQNYRYDLLSPETLLKKYVGKKLRVARYNEKLGTDEIKEAELIAIEGGPVLKIDGEIVTNYGGRYLFPEVPANLLPKPTLVWLLASGAAKQKLEVTYLTRNLGWKADYVLLLSPDDKLGDLAGWVTLENNTGTSYEDAELKLVAGDVQRVAPPPPPMAPVDMEASMPMAAPAPQFKQESLFEYHLYSLQRKTDLLDKERKQVRLLDAQGIGIQKVLSLRGEEWYFRNQVGGLPPKQKFGVYVKLTNSEKQGLGQPLPKGVVRVYKADKGGSRQFVGEDAIDHTPRDEEIEIKLGEAFDVLADRKQMTWRPLGSCGSESTWEIKVSNAKDAVQAVEIVEPANGDWEVVDSSHPAKREDAKSFKFTVDVPGRGSTLVTYRLRVRWC